MSSIGLYDWDMAHYIHVPPNLELMKLSRYFKLDRQIVSHTPKFAPDHYSKYYVRKDYLDGIYPQEIFQNNIKVGGNAFTKGKYKPMDEAIEKMKPDPYCYGCYEHIFGDNRTNSQLWSTMMNAQHMRLSLDGTQIWDKYESQILNVKPRCYFFHDVDLNSVEGARDLLNELQNAQKRTVYFGCKFPIQLFNAADIDTWAGLPVMQNNFCIAFNGIMDDDVFVAFLEKQQHTSFSKQLDYNVTYGCASEEEFLMNRLPQIFNQVTFARNNHYKISLKYNSNFFIDKTLEKMLDFFTSYINSIFLVGKNPAHRFCSVECDSLYSFATCLHETETLMYPFVRQDARDIFQTIRVRNYEVFKDFYEKSKVELKGGVLVNATSVYSRKH